MNSLITDTLYKQELNSLQCTKINCMNASEMCYKPEGWPCLQCRNCVRALISDWWRRYVIFRLWVVIKLNYLCVDPLFLIILKTKKTFDICYEHCVHFTNVQINTSGVTNSVLPRLSSNCLGVTSSSTSLSLMTDLRWAGWRLLVILIGESSSSNSTWSWFKLGPKKVAGLLTISSRSHVCKQDSSLLEISFLFEKPLLNSGVTSLFVISVFFLQGEHASLLLDPDASAVNESFFDLTGVSKSSKSSQSSPGNPRDTSRFVALFPLALVTLLSYLAGAAVTVDGQLLVGLVESDLPFELTEKKLLILDFWGPSSLFENIKGDLVTELFFGILTFLCAKTFELITLALASTLAVPDKDFFLNEKALKNTHDQN